MATLASKTVNGQLVYYDSAYPNRWLEAFGPNVCKVVEEFQYTPISAADTVAGWTTTLVEGGAGESTVALVGGATGGALLITTDGNEHDGVNMPVQGEAFLFGSAWPMYFGTKLRISDATESVLYAGVGLTDSNWDTGAPNDYIAFYKADAVTTANFIVAKGGTATTVESVATFVAATDVTLEFYFDGTNIYAYVNGVLATTIAASNANFPNTEYLTPTIDFTTGSAHVRTCQVDFVRAIQVQTTA
jgi:hypothetical protein